jgi:hypothetical protein
MWDTAAAEDGVMVGSASHWHLACISSTEEPHLDLFGRLDDHANPCFRARSAEH